MRENWSDNEVDLIVNDYFSMLIEELNGNSYNKSEHRRHLKPLLNDRPDLSIERKHQNISAVNIELGLPYIKGYKPLSKAQRSKLIPSIQRYILLNPEIQKVLDSFCNNADLVSPSVVQFDELLVNPPEKNKSVLMEPSPSFKISGKINYLEKEQHNITLGKKGEELALEFERNLLIMAGKEALAKKVEWVSDKFGDGAGFDILSSNLDGTDKYIEVKTTKLGIYSPFFFSSNEYKFSIINSENFHLYRIFNFSDSPKMFRVRGRYDKFCSIEAVQYKGHF
ncbi:uncharacterized protein DUF3883 [Arcticibacter pallidicorallinus]|uniref:Uncharacterized protein DUF3883 n=1 Tax=Arcticibacter pallidicorallinus TaxID=1259464 RepID=A0A2T0UC45_9SPHI|nr:DUF3883 domain-containing protein [Arcticibacter pallidicorallinus]PRY55493.1 uncharacterized protein DUF3883 [Arcticibacter pallidicorallinus]